MATTPSSDASRIGSPSTSVASLSSTNQKRKMYASPNAEEMFKIKIGDAPEASPTVASAPALQLVVPDLQSDIEDEIHELVPLSSDNVATLLLLVREFTAQRLLSDEESRLLKRSLLSLSTGGDRCQLSGIGCMAWSSRCIRCDS
jgi:hypothetical protein